MKIRADQVTNSSSVSYVCTVCGKNDGGSDYFSQSDYGFLNCSKGHTFCVSHLKDKSPADWTDEEVLADMEKEDPDYFKCYNKAPKSEKEGYISDWRSETCSNMPEKLCPICNLTSIKAETMLKYIKARDLVNLEELEDEIRRRFNTFEQVKKYIKENKR